MDDLAAIRPGCPSPTPAPPPAPARVKGGTVTLVAGGTCTVHADQRGDDEYAAAPRADDSFHVARTAQTIHFTRPDDTSMAAGTVRSPDRHVGAAVTVTVTSAASAGLHRRRRDRHAPRRRRMRAVARQDGDPRFAAAPDVTGTLTVLRDPAPVTVPAGAPPTAGVLDNSAGSATATGAAITLRGGGYKPARRWRWWCTPRRSASVRVHRRRRGLHPARRRPRGPRPGGHTLLAAGLAADNTPRC